MKTVRKSDDAVSEIIGAILLFAIASVLLTSFILWYVPSTGTNNDLSYQGGTQSSFSSLDSKMLSSSLTPGSAISQSFPLGISGTPPFTPTQSTNLYYSSNFNASLNYGLVVNYTNIVTNKTVDIAASANATTNNILDNNYVNSQFTYAVNFVENGLPAGYYWTVTVGGTQKSGSPTNSSKSDIISFSLPRGSFTYTITTNNRTNLPSPASGSVKVTNNETAIHVTFSNIGYNRAIVAAAYGPTNDVNSINSVNYIPVLTYFKKGEETIRTDYWLNNTALRMNKTNYFPLASQKFFVYQKCTPISYLKFYLEPNTQYYQQEYQGKASIFVEISHSSYSYNVNKSVAYGFENVSHTSDSNYFTSSSIPVNITLKSSENSILLDKHDHNTYYLNFFEAVNESKSKGILSHSYHLCFSNTSTGYGYGPNEFIGTISNPDISLNTGVSYYYEAIAHGCQVGGTGNPETRFHICSEQQQTSYSSTYYFLLGYNIPASSNAPRGALRIHETGLPTGSKWGFYLGDALKTNGTSSIICIRDLQYGQFNYSIQTYGTFISDPESGFVSISSNKTVDVNVSFFQPVGSLPSFWDISDEGVQSFTLSQTKEINFVSLYLYNFTIPPGAESTESTTNYVKIDVCNNSFPGTFVFNKVIQVTQTGWVQVFLTNSTNGYRPVQFLKGSYNIRLEDVTSTGGPSLSGSIGWGFATMGGYDNYMQRVESDTLSGQLDSNRTSVITPYNSNSPTTCDVTNQAYMYSIGYYNVTVSRSLVPYPINLKLNVAGSINSKGQTQFTLTKTEVLQDGIVLSAGSGVTYVTINPLPVRIVQSSSGISLSSIAYNMSLSKGISTSVSGSGSTIVSMTMTKEKTTNYTVGNSYIFDNKLGSVQSICLSDYSYDIHSTYAKYWADTLFTELEGSNAGNYTHFTLDNHFTFNLDGNVESINLINGHEPLYSVNFNSVDFLLNSL